MRHTSMDPSLDTPRKRAAVSNASSEPDFFPELAGEEAAAQESAEEQALSEKFAAFHRANPEVYREIKRRALALQAGGARRIGVKRIIEEMRDDWSPRTTGDARQLNNPFASRFARLLRDEVPDIRPLIETRTMRSA